MVTGSARLGRPIKTGATEEADPSRRPPGLFRFDPRRHAFKPPFLLGLLSIPLASDTKSTPRQVNRPRKLAKYPARSSGLWRKAFTYSFVKSGPTTRTPTTKRISHPRGWNSAAWRTYQKRERWMALAFRSGYASLGLSAIHVTVLERNKSTPGRMFNGVGGCAFLPKPRGGKEKVRGVLASEHWNLSRRSNVGNRHGQTSTETFWTMWPLRCIRTNNTRRRFLQILAFVGGSCDK